MLRSNMLLVFTVAVLALVAPSYATDYSPWVPTTGDCEWNSEVPSCTTGIKETSYSCPDDSCDPYADHATTSVSCTATFCDYICVPTSITDAEIPNLTSAPFCESNANFDTPTSTTTCYSETVSRRVLCYYTDGHMVMDSAGCDFRTAPESEMIVSDDSGCTFDYRCAPVGTTSFADANSCTNEADSGYGDCTVDCTTASKTRAFGCVNTDLGVDATDAARCKDVQEPVTETSCDTATKISITDVETASDDIAIAGLSGDVKFCYYGHGVNAPSSTLMTYASLVTLDTSYRIGSAASTSNEILVEYPKIAPSANTTIRVSNKKGDVYGDFAVSLESACDHGLDCGTIAAGTCVDSTSTCQCSTGYSGDSCSVTPCETLNCVAANIVSACDNSDAKCTCKTGYSGTRCEVLDSCKTTLTCKNNGFVGGSTDNCDTACTCVGDWTGNTCGTCSKACGTGSGDSTCSTCVCPRSFSGSACQCSMVYGVLTFPSTFNIKATDFQFRFKTELALITSLSADDFSFSTNSANLIVGIRDCPQTLAQSIRAPASWFVLSAGVDAWSSIKSDIDSDDSLLKSGSLNNVAVEAQSAVYDPTCTTDCAADPFPQPEAEPTSGSSDDTGMIVGAVIGSIVGLCVLILVVCLISRHCCKTKEQHAYGEKETEMAYNNRVSIYARPSIAVPADAYGATTEDVVIAVNARGESPKNQPMSTQYDTAISGQNNDFGYTPSHSVQ